jgi:DtxR family transcriptional regulator, Mn-dependent transcriptional regulator
MIMQESGEMYLETIYRLSLVLPVVRSIDVSEYMGYSKPSVSRAIGILKSEELITVDKLGYITLTDAGREHAKNIYDRHKCLTRLFTLIGVSPETAADDACRVEHYISDETFRAIKRRLAELETEEETAKEE